MTIEQKAKAYDEALEKLRSLHDDYDTVSTLIDIKEELENIFPELKESEDEEIRKELIDIVAKSPITFAFKDKEKVLDWLEKQGNTNVFNVPEISIKDAVEVTSRVQHIKDDMKPIAEFIMDYADWDLHADVWSQPTITVPLFRVLDALIQRGKPYCYRESVQNIEKQDEQKPTAWSEEDEKLFDKIGDLIHEAAFANCETDDVGNELGEYAKMMHLLDCLKGRVQPQPQPKQEWSEEDEKMVNNILTPLAGRFPWNIYQPMYDWLKALKERIGGIKYEETI